MAGRTVRTAVWRPVTGRRVARRLISTATGRATSPATAGSSGRCFYQMESYRYWEGEFGRDDFSFG